MIHVPEPSESFAAVNRVSIGGIRCIKRGKTVSSQYHKHLSHLLARNGPGYFFNGEETNDVIVHSQNVTMGTMTSKTRDGLVFWKMAFAPSMGVPSQAVLFISMVNRGVEQRKAVLGREKRYPALTWSWDSRATKP